MSSSKKANLIPVGKKKLEEERCGTCKNYLYLKTLLDLSTKKRILVVACDTCNYETTIKSLEEYEKFSIEKPKSRTGWKY